MTGKFSLRPSSTLFYCLALSIISSSPGIFASNNHGGQEGYGAKSDNCGCGLPITKIVIQPVDLNIAVPQFVKTPKTFAELVPTTVQLPNFIETEEIILKPDVPSEIEVESWGVDYEWIPVTNRVAVYNSTKETVERYKLVKTPVYNQSVTFVETEYVDTTVREENEDYEETIVEYDYEDIKVDTVLYTDTELIVEEIVRVPITEHVEVIEYVDTEITVWHVILEQKDYFEKEVVRDNSAGSATVDDITITRKQVSIPQVKITTKDVIIHEPVTITNIPVPYPQFYNETVKVPIISRKTIAVPNFLSHPVIVPIYHKISCNLKEVELSKGFIPETCDACPACTPCKAMCNSQRSMESQRLNAGSSSSASASASSFANANYGGSSASASASASASSSSFIRSSRGAEEAQDDDDLITAASSNIQQVQVAPLTQSEIFDQFVAAHSEGDREKRSTDEKENDSWTNWISSIL